MLPGTPIAQSPLTHESEHARDLELWEEELACFRKDDRSDLISHP